jgi:hypothetical protein
MHRYLVCVTSCHYIPLTTDSTTEFSEWEIVAASKEDASQAVRRAFNGVIGDKGKILLTTVRQIPPPPASA